MNRDTGRKLFWMAAAAGSLLAARQVIPAEGDPPARSHGADHRGLARTGPGDGPGSSSATAEVRHLARDADELERARSDLSGLGAQVVAIPCDVTSRSEVEGMVRLVLDRFDGIDILVNNAGIIQVGPFDVTTLEDYEHAMKTHFWGPLYTTLAVLPEMRRRGAGRIVNISSIGGKLSTPAPAALRRQQVRPDGLLGRVAAELARDGILVTTVIPGLMRTGSPRHALFKGQHRAGVRLVQPGRLLAGALHRRRGRGEEDRASLPVRRCRADPLPASPGRRPVPRRLPRPHCRTPGAGQQDAPRSRRDRQPECPGPRQHLGPFSFLGDTAHRGRRGTEQRGRAGRGAAGMTRIVRATAV